MGEPLVGEPLVGEPLVYFNFPRQNRPDAISAVDWIRPELKGGDSICLFVVTSGTDMAEAAAAMREDGRFLDFHFLQAIGADVTLTEGMMMSPEGSVSAVVFRHPYARY